MIIYITKPECHECVMGGLRHVQMWAEEPHYHHYPEDSHLISGTSRKYYDKGWRVKAYDKGIDAKPLLKQDEELYDNVWNRILWSCAPKGVAFEDVHTWSNTPSPACSTFAEGEYNNFTNLLMHRPHGRQADVNANINFKRFLLEVHIRTNEVKILTPTVHWAYGDKKGVTEKTLLIEPEFALSKSYILVDDDEFSHGLNS